MKKRITALLLALALLLSVLPQTALTASAEELSGVCGPTLNWTLDAAAGELVITGSGAMYDWDAPESVPWYAYRASIRTVSLPRGLTGIGSNAFAGCTALTEITIPDSAANAGSYGTSAPSGAQPPKRGASAQPNAEGPVTVTTGMLVANAYEGLSDAEKAILNSDYVLGQSYTYTVPTEAEDLIAVDAEIRRITASPYTDRGFTWQPVSATVIYDGGTETVALTDGKGTFSYEGNSYHVQVEYALDIAVDRALQEKLLNGPCRLAKGLDDLDVFYGADGSLTTIASNIMPLKQLADGVVIGGSITITLGNAVTKDAIWRLCAQVKKNGKFDISLKNDEYYNVIYGENQSAVKYLVEKGSSFKATAVQAYADLKQIAGDVGIDQLLSYMDSNDAKKARIAIRAMESVAQELEEAATDDWAVLEASPLKSGLSNADYLALDELVSAVSADAPHENELSSPIRAATVTIESNVNQHNVTVSVSASRVSPATIDSAQLTPLETHSRTLHLPDGATRAELLQAIMKSGIEASALASWVVVTAEGFERSVSELPAVLTEDITYAISYQPKNCTVIYEDELMQPLVVPYGYNLTLPVYGDPDYVFDYEIDGQGYLQSTVYTVRGDVTIRRSINIPWEILRINELAAQCCADELTAQEQAVLNSPALDSDYLLLRRPKAEYYPVTVGFASGGYRVTAQSVPSGVQGLSWLPASGKAYSASGAELAAFSFVDNEALFTADGVDHVEVQYALTISTVSEAQILRLLQLPGVLAAEAKEQKRIIDIPNSIYSELGSLDKPTLNKINLAVKGSEMTDKSKAAVQRILDVCVDEEKAKLYVYDFLTLYRKNGLVEYYRNDNDLMLQAQIGVLNDNLSQIYNDPGFLQLLRDMEYEDKYDQIGEIIDKLGQTYLQSPNPAILLNHAELPELVRLIEAADGKTAAHESADRPLQLFETLTANAPKESSVELTVRLLNSAGEELGVQTETVRFSVLQPLTAADVSALQTKLDALTAQLGVFIEHYETADKLTLKAGDVIREAVRVELRYTPRRYTVRFVENGAEVDTGSFPYDVPAVTLPACPEPASIYRYTVLGEQIAVGSEARTYMLTSEQLEGLGSAPLTVTREKLGLEPHSVFGVGTDAFKGCTALAKLTVLDPKCVIADTATTLGVSASTTIYGYVGSTAQSYAQKYGYTFVAISTSVSAQGYTGVYDGASHTARISVTGPMSFTIRYSTTGALTASNYETGAAEPPSRSDAGVTKVWFYVKDAAGYYGDCPGQTEILILPRVTATGFSGMYDGQTHTAAVTAEGGATVYYSTDTALDFGNYAAFGSKTAPERTEEGTTRVYYVAVPDRDATEASCVSGETSLEVLDHVHNYTCRLTAAPTAEASGCLSCTCSVCRQILSVTLPALNKTDYDYSVLSEPSCVGEGVGKYTWKTISYGLYSFNEPIVPLGHSYVNGICARCGKKQETLLFKTELENAVAAAEGIDTAPYTAQSVAALAAAIEAAKKTLADAISQQELDDAETELYAAIAGLVLIDTPLTLDKAGLQAAITAAEKVVREDYTAESLAVMDAVLAGARRTLNEAILQSELDTAEAELDAAILGLIPKTVTPPQLDRTALRAAINAAEKINKSDYTLETVAVLETALAEAKGVIANATVQAELDKAEALLIAALHALQRKILFDDVNDPSKFYYDAVYWAVANEVTTGMSSTKFKPNDGCTRGQVVAFLWRAAGKPAPKQSNNPFTDVAAGKFYTEAVLWAVEQGITEGTSRTKFSPNKTCTRGQIVTFLYRFEKQPAAASTNNPFVDVKKDAFYYDAVLWAVGAGITEGTSKTKFSPTKTCTRGHVVTFLYRDAGKR